jgi:hypothetical protein
MKIMGSLAWMFLWGRNKPAISTLAVDLSLVRSEGEMGIILAMMLLRERMIRGELMGLSRMMHIRRGVCWIEGGDLEGLVGWMVKRWKKDIMKNMIRKSRKLGLIWRRMIMGRKG